MSEYEELVKTLRLRAELWEKVYGEESVSEKAADAIEKLSAYAKLYEELTDKGQKTARKLIDAYPRWISVKKALPEQKINQNTLDFEYVLCATTFGDVRPYKYGRRIGQGDAHFWNGAGYVDAYITHWMPLPKPPQEVNDGT